MDGDLRQLIDEARRVREQAYAPYSNFLVGAALQTTGGDCFTGCNVENASYGLTVCAERVAVSTAVAAGYREFVAIAIASETCAPPCGACRQFLAEFSKDLTIVLVNTATGDVSQTSLNDLLPQRFEAH